ncbi:MAG: hypothetical protein II758_05940 [Prevotella sp.]|nr:hypothetical protein [Prevotella sp.]
MEKNRTIYTAPSIEIFMMDLTGALNAGVSGGGNQVETIGAKPGSIGGGAGGAHTKEYVLEDVDLWSNEEEEE